MTGERSDGPSPIDWVLAAAIIVAVAIWIASGAHW